MGIIKLGNISFNSEAFKDVLKEDFIQCYRGQLDGIDIEQAFEIIQKENAKTEIKEEKKTEKAPKKK